MNRHAKGFGVTGFILAGLFACSFLYADEIIIPFSISNETFIRKALINGIDLRDGEESDGFIKNEGMRLVVYTYRSFSPQELDILKDAAFKSVRKT